MMFGCRGDGCRCSWKEGKRQTTEASSRRCTCGLRPRVVRVLAFILVVIVVISFHNFIGQGLRLEGGPAKRRRLREKLAWSVWRGFRLVPHDQGLEW